MNTAQLKARDEAALTILRSGNVVNPAEQQMLATFRRRA